MVVLMIEAKHGVGGSVYLKETTEEDLSCVIADIQNAHLHHHLTQHRSWRITDILVLSFYT